MASSGTLRRVALVRTNVSEELTTATRCNIPENAILHSHHRENLESYTIPPMSQKMISIFLNLFFSCLAFSVSVSLNFSTKQSFVTNDNPGQEGCIVGGELTKLLADKEKICF
jgi:hypothetical protein